MAEGLREAFKNPPDSSRPGVYWYFMDGNMSRQGITDDLESMKQAGIGNLIFLEVNVGVPRGSVDFLSEEWQELFKHAVREAERLGINITLGSGPGWTGSGGPWVKLEQSMQHLVASSIEVKGPAKCDTVLPVPDPRAPYFGPGALDEHLTQRWKNFYKDVAVLTYPTPTRGRPVTDIDEKAFYYRAPYTSVRGVKPFLPAPARFSALAPGRVIDKEKIIDLTAYLQPDGHLAWDVPAGNWTIMRFGRRNNGAVTRPAPQPGLGFECDKFDTAALNAHFENYIGKLLDKTNPRKHGANGGWTMLHMDSWEMGAQNWTEKFRQEFQHRRGYDPLPYLPVYTGSVVGSLELSERFLWDLRVTAQELVLENHAGHLKELGRRYGFGLSIEPYDMNPCADLELGSLADVPMGEFWSKGFGFNSSFSCIEAASIAHTAGRIVVQAEAFTAGPDEAWKLYPAVLKNQGDWAFCAGINRLFYHTFAHKPLGDNLRPGMVMGPYGVHWDRYQTWWPMVSAYHRYITRCQFLLQRGTAVADIVYLTPEGAPHVFRPPLSAMTLNDTIPDRRGYNFDGCSPGVLISRACVQDNRIVFPGGTSYCLLVLPASETMTPELLDKIVSLVNEGATVVGMPPVKSPSLCGYPYCDQRVRSTAVALWGSMTHPKTVTERTYGKGKIFWGGECSKISPGGLYPKYAATAAILEKTRAVDFKSTGSVRYTHRRTDDQEIYFIANRTGRSFQANCFFRDGKSEPELWDPLNGETRRLPEFRRDGEYTVIPVRFEPYQSFFIVFGKKGIPVAKQSPAAKNFPLIKSVAQIKGSWSVSFDPKWGGPDSVTFEKLYDWSKRREEGIKFYSGIAVYRKVFDLPEDPEITGKVNLFLDLGRVNNIARIHLNGKDLGVVWTAPWRVNITDAVRQHGNILDIEVANLWPNRLIGDERLPENGIANGQWPEWLVKHLPRTSGRYTFTTYEYYKKYSPLVSSGLLGPITLLRSNDY